MKLPIIQIGNSKGIRIPKPILEQCGFQNEVEIEIQNDKLILKPVKHVRKNWDKAFKEMALNKDDKLLIDFPENYWDETEWEWK